MDLAGRRRQKVRQQVEARRLAGAIWPDQGVNCVAFYAQIDVLDRDEALELLRQPGRLKNYFFVGHRLSLSRELIEALDVCPALASASARG